VVRVELVTDPEEQERVFDFIDGVALRWYQCTYPRAAHSALFAAKQGSEIVGSVAVDFTDDAHPFPYEEVYEFDHTTTPLPFKRENIVQGSKWAATAQGVSHLLLNEMSRYALSIGKKYLLIQAKSSSIKRLTEFGIHCLPISDAKIVWRNVPVDIKHYYEEHPLPELFMVDIQQMFIAVKKFL